MNIQKKLELHKKWLNGDPGGEYADLQGANLWGADLQGANLWGANLHGADLRGADLRGANVDYSCLPLWCGSLHMKVDKRIAAQIAYHFCALECDDPEVQKAQQSLYALANTFHRVGELLPRLGE